MHVVNLYIEISDENRTLFFDSIAEIEIENSWENLGSKATIKIPKRFYVDENNGDLEQPFIQGCSRVDELLKRGQKVLIRFGYEPNIPVRYRGYVEHIKAGTPVEIVCEDELFTLKTRSVKPKVFTNTKLSDVLQYCGITNYELLGEISGFDFHITPEEINVAKVLMKLKDKLYMPFFFKGKTLVIGNVYDLKNYNTHILAFGYNIAEHELEFKRKEDVKLLVKVTIHKKGGKKEEFTAQGSDTDGEQRTLNFYNLSKSDAEKAAARELERLKFTGLRGTVKAFGEPHIQVGDVIDFVDAEESEKEGKYWVDAVKSTLSKSGGIRQEITLGVKL